MTKELIRLSNIEKSFVSRTSWANVLNPKRVGFTQQEKDRLGVRGLVPPRTQTMDFQARRVMMNLNMCSDNLEKYVFLSSLQDRNETLFFKVLMEG